MPLISLLVLYPPLSGVKSKNTTPYPGDLGPLTVYNAHVSLERVGNQEGDGGYVIAKSAPSAYDAFISGGVQYDTSFENAWAELYHIPQQANNSKFWGIAFDGSVERAPELPKAIEFRSEMVGFGEPISVCVKHFGQDDECENRLVPQNDLGDILRTQRNVFVKLDIEGAEWAWFHNAPEPWIQNMKQITMEVHGLGQDGYGTTKKQKLKILSRLTKSHILIWVHTNNYSDPADSGTVAGVPIASAVEMTWIRKDMVPADMVPVRATSPIPGHLDRPNGKHLPDVPMNHPPWRCRGAVC